MFDAIFDLIRNFLFSFAQLGGFIADSLYEVLKVIATIDVGEFSGLWIWYALMITLVGAFTSVRVCSMWVKASFNDEYRDTKYKPFNAISGIVTIMLVLAIFPLGMKYATSVSQYAIENAGVYLNNNTTSNDIKPTDIIITSVVNGLASSKIDVTAEKKQNNNTRVTYTMNEIGSKLNDRKDGKYVYLPEIWHIFFVSAVLIVFGIGISLLSFQFGKRIYSIIMKIVIAPLPISSLVNADSDSFGVWIKMMIADLMTNFIQYLLLFIVLLFATSELVIKLGFFVSAVLLLAGLFFILEGIPQIAQLIGGDTSTGTVLQQLSTIRQASTGFGRGLSNAMSFGAGAAVTAGAFGIYGAGRATGANSLLKTGGNFSGIMNQSTQNVATGSNTKDYFTKNQDQYDSNEVSANGITKENSLANRFGNYGATNIGKRAATARMVSNASRHLYQKSAERLANNKVANGISGMNQFRRNMFQNNKVNIPDKNATSVSQYQPFSNPDLDQKRSNEI